MDGQECRKASQERLQEGQRSELMCMKVPSGEWA